MNKALNIAIFVLVACQLTQAINLRTESGSRDFSAWMKTVPSTYLGSGLKALLVGINPVIPQAMADQWSADITAAAGKFPTFCNSGDNEKDMAEFSAFLAIIGAETSFNQAGGFPCTVEVGCPNCNVCSYDTRGKECLNNTALQYFGRGPLQLSWNFNYAAYSQYLYNDESILVEDPSKVTANGQSCWSSAIWFWMARHQYGGWCMPVARWPAFTTCNSTCYNGPSGCSDGSCSSEHWLKREVDSCHNAMVGGGSGFGQVINIINGGYDCCQLTDYQRQVTGRMSSFLYIYNLWAKSYPISDLSSVSMPDCPLGNGMDCSGGNCSL